MVSGGGITSLSKKGLSTMASSPDCVAGLAEVAVCAINDGMVEPETRLTMRMRSAVNARGVLRFMVFLGWRFREKRELRERARRAKRLLYEERKTAFTFNLLVNQCSISQVLK
jgi:hypothetical protein